MFFVAYNEDESVVVQGVNDQAGKESFFDLGPTTSFVSAIQSDKLIDTNITLADFSVSSWSEVYVGMFGQKTGGLSDTTAFFSSDDPSYTYNALNFGFSNGYSQVQTFLSAEATGSNIVRDKIQNNSYYGKMQASGTEPGSYGGPVGSGDSFGAEFNLDGIGVTSAEWLTLAVYGGDTFADQIPPGGFNGQLPLIAKISLGLDPADNSLQINPVPVPAAVWLLGSGLLALVGIRRRRMR
jgi:hypothetical protein